MLKERRCNLFDDNRKPRRLRDGTKGCPKDASACKFAHPHERCWETAKPSYPPKHDGVADDDDEFYYILIHSDRREREKERDRGRERETSRKLSSSYRDSSPHRRDSATSYPSPGASSRRSTFDSAPDSAGGTKRGRSPALSSNSDQLERLRKDDHLPSDPRYSPLAPSLSRRSRSRSRDRDRRGDVSTKMPHAVTDPRRPNAPAAQQPLMLPPEPPKPAPMQPPPPPPQVPEVPKLPSFVQSAPVASSSTAPPLEEQRAVWHERIDLMFTSITLRRDYTKLESDLSQLHFFSNSSLMNNLPEADRDLIDKQKMALERQMESKRKEINESMQKLIMSNFWPILRTPRISEMERSVDEVKKHVSEVRGLLDDVKSSCTALFKTTSVTDWSSADADRPTKRRRLDGEADTPVQETAELVAESTTKELKFFRDKLMALDRHLVDLENDITQRDAIVTDEIELRIDSRLQDEYGVYSPTREPGEIFEHEIEAVVNRKNQELVSAVDKTGQEIGELAVEVAELITKVNDLEARCTSLEAENKGFRDKLAKDSLEHEKSQEALMQRDKQIEAIAAAFTAYISQTTVGQSTGELPTAEYIIESLGSELDSLFREKFGPKLVDVQKEVYTKVEESNSRTLDTISPSIMMLSRMVNLITTRLGKPDSADAMGAV